MTEDSGEMIAEINLTPLVDVSLVLVIVFMAAAPSLTRTLRSMELPRAERAALNERDALRVSVFLDRTLTLGDAPVEEAALSGRLRRELARAGPSWVLVRADARVDHGRVMRIVRLAREAGARRIAFAARPKK